MSKIDPTARVEDGAVIGDGTVIGPYCVIGPNVVIGANCRLISHVQIMGHTRLGDDNVISPFVVLGGAPQDLSYRGEPHRLEIGSGCTFREGVTMNIGTVDGGGVTKVGARGFYMANAHVAHDCIVGDDVVFANSATLGGHCEVGDHVFIGGLSAVHQRTRIGAHAIIGGVSGIRGDVIPFGLASGDHARMVGINVVGMKRRNFAHAAIASVRRAYRQLFFGISGLEAEMRATEEQFGAEPAVARILAFIRGRGKRPLCRPVSVEAGGEGGR